MKELRIFDLDGTLCERTDYWFDKILFYFLGKLWEKVRYSLVRRRGIPPVGDYVILTSRFPSASKETEIWVRKNLGEKTIFFNSFREFSLQSKIRWLEFFSFACDKIVYYDGDRKLVPQLRQKFEGKANISICYYRG